jgi:hypothetical protein
LVSASLLPVAAKDDERDREKADGREDRSAAAGDDYTSVAN